TVLVDDDELIYDTAIITEYLEEKYPTTPLMPNDQLQRAKVRIWIDFFNSRIHPAAHDITHDKEPEKAKERMQNHLCTLDDAIAGKEYIAGTDSLDDRTVV